MIAPWTHGKSLLSTGGSEGSVTLALNCAESLGSLLHFKAKTARSAPGVSVVWSLSRTVPVRGGGAWVSWESGPPDSGMGEDRAAKLRLKRPRAAAEFRPSGYSCSWFEEKELSDSGELWKLVLQVMSPSLKDTTWDTVPPLPEFHKKYAGNEKKPRKTETFNAGIKRFEWAAFPSFPEVDQVPWKTSNLYRPLHGQATSLIEEGTVPLLKEKSLAFITPPSVVGREPGAPSVNSSTQQNAEVDAKEMEPENPSMPLKLRCPAKNVQTKQEQRASVGISVSLPASSQNSEQSLGVGSLAKQNPVQDKDKAREPLLETVTEEERGSAGASSKAGDLREGSGEVAALLQACPMCLVQFTERFTQLDVDCHLAQCLSESAEDIVW